MHVTIRLKLAFFIAVAVAAFTSSVHGAPIQFEVPGTVQPLQQVGNTCWATTAAILLSWKKNASLPVATVAAQAGPDYAALYAAGDGLPTKRKAEFLQKLGFSYLPPMCYQPEGLLALLKEKGALWITVDSGAAAFTHAVIVTGMAGDGTAANTRVHYVDPAFGTTRAMAFNAFEHEFESAAGKADIQVVTAN